MGLFYDVTLWGISMFLKAMFLWLLNISMVLLPLGHKAEGRVENGGAPLKFLKDPDAACSSH